MHYYYFVCINNKWKWWWNAPYICVRNERDSSPRPVPFFSLSTIKYRPLKVETRVPLVNFYFTAVCGIVFIFNIQPWPIDIYSSSLIPHDDESHSTRHRTSDLGWQKPKNFPFCLALDFLSRTSGRIRIRTDAIYMSYRNVTLRYRR